MEKTIKTKGGVENNRKIVLTCEKDYKNNSSIPPQALSFIIKSYAQKHKLLDQRGENNVCKR